jgi:hypothetical protein
MEIRKADVESVLKELKPYFDIDVEYDNTLLTVYAETNKGISEFEAYLVASITVQAYLDPFGEFLDNFTDFVDMRIKFEPVVSPSGTWIARYSLTWADDE